MKRFHITLIQRTVQSAAAIVALTILSCSAVKADVLVQYSMDTNAFATAPANGGAASGTTAPYADIVDGSLVSSASTISVGPGDPNVGGNSINITLTYRTSTSGGAGTDQTGGSGPALLFPTLNAQLPNSNGTDTGLGPYAAPSGGFAGDPLVYFQFSLTAASDFNLNDLYFDLAMGSSSTATRGVDVQYSLDNFSTFTDLGAFGTGNQTADNYFFNSVNLGNVLVTSGQTLTVRFDPYSTSGGGIRFDNIGLDATPVPEPATLALSGLTGVAVLFLKRRKV